MKIEFQFLNPITKLGKPIYPKTQSLGGTFNQLLEGYELRFVIYIDGRSMFCTFKIPAGFVWDGASIPRFAWSLIGVRPEGAMLLPSLFHDYLYRSEGLRNGHGQSDLPQATVTGKTIYSRLETDCMFRALMVWTGNYNGLQRGICYGIVRPFGHKYWAGPAPDFNHKRK